MNTILIKPQNKKMYSQIIECIKYLKIPARILTATIEEDMLLIDRIEESMKAGAAPKKEIEAFFKKHGIRI